MKHNTKTIYAIIGAALLVFGGVLAAGSLKVSAQLSGTNSSNTTTSSTVNSTKQSMYPAHRNIPNAPNITGSVPLASTINSAISSKIKTSLDEAILTAQKAVSSNSSAISASIRPLNGYLVYVIHVVNKANNTLYSVIVDPGNGKILYNHAVTPFKAGHSMMFDKGRMGQSFGAFGGGFGCHWSGHRSMNNDGGGSSSYFHNRNTDGSPINSNIFNNI